MIINVETFKKYSNVFIEDTELQEYYLQAAQDIVSSYLGYNPEFELLNYKTGELEDDFEMPEIIKLTILRIASLLQTESDSNIGVTSKSFGDSGNRTFVNTVSFDKYLIQISQYRVIRI